MMGNMLKWICWNFFINIILTCLNHWRRCSRHSRKIFRQSQKKLDMQMVSLITHANNTLTWFCNEFRKAFSAEYHLWLRRCFEYKRKSLFVEASKRYINKFSPGILLWIIWKIYIYCLFVSGISKYSAVKNASMIEK